MNPPLWLLLRNKEPIEKDIWCKVDNQISTYASTFAAQSLRTKSELRCFNFVLKFTDTKKIIIAHISIQIDLIFRKTSLIDWKLGQKRPPSLLASEIDPQNFRSKSDQRLVILQKGLSNAGL